MEGQWPADIEALELAGAGTATPLSCGTLVWKHAGALRVTVIAKATFDLVHDQPMRLRAPDEIVTRDRHLDNNPLRSVRDASDVVPFRSRADVTLVGHAHAPGAAPTTAMVVRLALYRETKILERALHVYGDRDDAGNLRTFQRMPLVPECALATGDNPIGSKSPNVVDSRGPTLAGSFAPISRYWPPRARLLRGAQPPAGDAFIEIPNDFDWGYFQAAPAEQQTTYLRGDEWLVLDGMHPAVPRLKTRLPMVRTQAMVHAMNGPRLGPGRALALSIDTLAIDGDRVTCSIGFRGAFPIQSEESLSALKILVGLELGGAELRWPAPETIGPPRAVAPLRMPAPGDLGTTKTLEARDAPPLNAAVPFVTGVPSAPRPRVPSFASVDDDTDQGGGTSVYVPPIPVARRSQPSVPFALQEPARRNAGGLAAEDDIEGTFNLSAEESRMLLEPPAAPTFGLPPLPKELAPHPAPAVSFESPLSAPQPVVSPIAHSVDPNFDGTIDLSASQMQLLAQREVAPFAGARDADRKPTFAVPSMRSDDDDDAGGTSVLNRDEVLKAGQAKLPALPFGGPSIATAPPAAPAATAPPPMMRDRARTLPSASSSMASARSKPISPPVVIAPPTIAAARFVAPPPPAPPPPAPPPPGPPPPELPLPTSSSSNVVVISSGSLLAIEERYGSPPSAIDPGAPTTAEPDLGASGDENPDK